MATVTIIDTQEGKEIGQSRTPYIADARTRGFRAVQHRNGIAAFVADEDGVFVVYWWNQDFAHVSCFAYRCAHESAAA